MSWVLSDLAKQIPQAGPQPLGNLLDVDRRQVPHAALDFAVVRCGEAGIAPQVLPWLIFCTSRKRRIAARLAIPELKLDLANICTFLSA